MSAIQFFSELHVKDFPFDKEVVTIDATTPVDKAFKTLVENHISAAPIFDKAKNTYVGFFDIADMVAYIVEMIHNHSATDQATPLPEVFNDLSHFLMVVTHYVPVTVDQVANHSHNNPFLPVYEDSSMLDVLSLLAHRGVHRVPVIDRTSGCITKLITQSAVTKWFTRHPEALAVFGDETVGHSSMGLCNVLTISSESPAIRALELLASSKLSGIGLVDTTGVMITTLSNSDLRILTTGKKFRLFGITALQLVQKSRALEANARPAIVCVRTTNALTDIVKRLSATGLHRVYVLDDHEKPIGVISLRDLIRFILPKVSDKPVNWQ